jgi:hypothetical protein
MKRMKRMKVFPKILMNFMICVVRPRHRSWWVTARASRHS